MSYENECENLLRKALAGGELTEDFDPNKIPQTGEEYIQYVMYESKKCQEWTLADIPASKIQAPTIAFCNEPKGCKSASKEILPSSEWQKQQVADFSAFRLHIEKLKLNETSTSKCPSTYDKAFWKNKCSEPPKLQDVLWLNQSSLCKLLEYQLEWLNDIQSNDSIPFAQNVWLYAILSALETPLLPDTCASLRNIARKCSEIRSFLKPNTDEQIYKPLNLFICIIAKYFCNHDLADDN